MWTRKAKTHPFYILHCVCAVCEHCDLLSHRIDFSTGKKFLFVFILLVLSASTSSPFPFGADMRIFFWGGTSGVYVHRDVHNCTKQRNCTLHLMAICHRQPIDFVCVVCFVRLFCFECVCGGCALSRSKQIDQFDVILPPIRLWICMCGMFFFVFSTNRKNICVEKAKQALRRDDKSKSLQFFFQVRQTQTNWQLSSSRRSLMANQLLLFIDVWAISITHFQCNSTHSSKQTWHYALAHAFYSPSNQHWHQIIDNTLICGSCVCAWRSHLFALPFAYSRTHNSESKS